MSFSSPTATAAGILGAGLSLSHLSSFWVPPQVEMVKVSIKQEMEDGAGILRTESTGVMKMFAPGAS